MNKQCKNCEFARYTPHDAQVGCGYWSGKYFMDHGEHVTEETRNAEMVQSGIKKAWLGWVYLQRRPEKETSEFLGEGIMTNMCIITNEDDYCNKHEDRR